MKLDSKMVMTALRQRREALGMSYAVLSRRSGVPIATVKRVFIQEGYSPSFEHLAKVAIALGVSLGIVQSQSPEQFMEEQAEKKARQLVGMVQGTSMLEGQGVDPEAYERMVWQAKTRLLAGARRRMWEV